MGYDDGDLPSRTKTLQSKDFRHIMTIAITMVGGCAIHDRILDFWGYHKVSLACTVSLKFL
jgi:hypothetical protein